MVILMVIVIVLRLVPTLVILLVMGRSDGDLECSWGGTLAYDLNIKPAGVPADIQPTNLQLESLKRDCSMKRGARNG